MNKRFVVLDSFRGLFALFVVLFHMHIVSSLTEVSFFRGSTIFVEFFFVLSGFVMSYGYGYREELNFKKFLISRTFRLFPLHIAMLGCFLVLEIGRFIAFKNGITFNYQPFTGNRALSEVIPNLLLIQSWSNYFDPLSFNSPSWSISIEFYMYLIFYMTLVAFRKTKVFIWLLILLISLTLGMAGSNVLTQQALRGLSCFFSGSLVYLAFRKLHEKIKLNYLTWSVIEFVDMVLIFLLVSFKFPNKNVFAIILFGVSIFVFAFENGVISKLLIKELFRLFGELSYSIYMVHAFILACVLSALLIVGKITDNNLTPTINGVRYFDLGTPILNNTLVFIILLTVIIMSIITHKYIEKPGQAIGKEMIKDKN